MKLLIIALLCVGLSDAFSGSGRKSSNKQDCDHKAGKKWVKDHELLFDQMDKDGDGELTPDDVKRFFNEEYHDKEVGEVTTEDAEAMISEGDTNGNGRLSKNEWIHMLVNKEAAKYDLKLAFENLHNGVIYEQELIDLFTRNNIKKPVELARTIMDLLDCNKDGKLTYEEFLDFVATHEDYLKKKMSIR